MATKRMEIYKSQECGTVIEVLHGSDCAIQCGSGGEMAHLTENTTDAAQEKHVPVIEKVDGGFKVKVGSVAHPMEEKHFIEFVEVATDDGKLYRQYLNPGDAPEAVFKVDAASVTAREYCNLHGLWKATS